MPRFIKQNTTLIDLENRAYYLYVVSIVFHVSIQSSG